MLVGSYIRGSLVGQRDILISPLFFDILYFDILIAPLFKISRVCVLGVKVLAASQS